MKRFFVTSALFLFPLAAFAVPATTDIFVKLLAVVNTAAPVLVGLAVLFFFWGLGQYILASGDETKKAEGRNIMIYGILALFVMVSVWGLVKLVQNTLQIWSDSAPDIPGVIGV